MPRKQLVSLNEIHLALIECGFNRRQTAQKLNVSRSYLNIIIKNKLVKIPTRQEYNLGYKQ